MENYLPPWPRLRDFVCRVVQQERPLQETLQTMRRADDWPFCHSRQNKITAVVWSGRQHRLTPTKKKAEAAIRGWKRWKERHGWVVRPLDTGYAATSPKGLREGCFLHTYDFDSRVRID